MSPAGNQLEKKKRMSSSVGAAAESNIGSKRRRTMEAAEVEYRTQSR